jgi:hypothetical protein
MFIYKVTGLESTIVKQTAAKSRTGPDHPALTIPVEVGDVVFTVWGNQNDPVTFAGTSSENPIEEHLDDAFIINISGVFKPSADNPNFNITTNTVQNSQEVAATWQ